MTWEPGQPVVTAADVAEWEAWRHARKLEQQRHRRKALARIDYYPVRKPWQSSRPAPVPLQAATTQT
jgi:hypothetical protein